MSRKPAYFEGVRISAAKRWDQLERDPELAGPWHQLFKQVQSPRHVISELLQNADDAGATEAAVDIRSGEFIFSHNGEDFTNEHFASLCRFGYSNKRALHTIGFRGVGFKSTFSLGDEVRLLTPTLAVRFGRQRFTQPFWIDSVSRHPRSTEVRVNIKDPHRTRELEKNLAEWLHSPASLLFFRHIRRLRIGEQEVRWVSRGRGPISNSQWMGLSAAPEQKFLLIRSDAEDFPQDSLEEIRQERMVSVDEETSFPPCRVEIVLGLEGRLFVILPTGVKTALPFACNAPFVQDPARVKIKDPETSPTNRWLLKRTGELAAAAMLAWLGRTDLAIEQRCEAYKLLSDVDQDDNSLEGMCAATTEQAFEDTIRNAQFLTSETGQLEPWNGCVTVPDALFAVWSAEQIVSLFVHDGRSILSHHVDSASRGRLIHWGCVEEIEKLAVLQTLESEHLPKPGTWRQLMALWAYVHGDVTGYHYYRNYKAVRIVPVQGKEVLYAASEVVRLGEKKLLQSDEDWQFLSEHLLVLNPNWLRFMAEQRHKAQEHGDELLSTQVEAVYGVLNALGMHEASDVSQVIQQVASEFYSQDKCPLDDCVRLARLAATLNATASDSFQFVTRDGYRKPITQVVIADQDGTLDTFVQKEWYEKHVLHDDYSRGFTSCTESEWRQWISSGRSKLLTFVPLTQTSKWHWGRDKFLEFLRERGLKGEPYYRYVTDNFVFEDWDFSDGQWRQWHTIAKSDPELWGQLFSRILNQPRSYWFRAISPRAAQVATTGNTQAVTQEPLLPAWIIKFRNLPCLQDTRGKYRQPAELLRRAPDTESLLEVEPFVRAELDTESTRPLLIMLGVRDTPTGPDRLLERLRALATVDNPPVYEVEKWCHRLDQLVGKCSTEEFEVVREAFAKEKIILTEGNGWGRTADVFLASDEEGVPGAPLVHSSVRNLTLWHRVGVADRPTVDLAMKWLTSLPSGQYLSQDEINRVRSLLPRYPERIWNQCGHWLNLEGEWVPTEQLAYTLAMQSLVAWTHLFTSIKQKTADLQKLSTETCAQPPFSGLRALADCIENRFQRPLYSPSVPERKPWLVALGRGLRRTVFGDQDDTQRVRDLANRLVGTGWQTISDLETVPYIDGTPAGVPRHIDVLWKDSQLYVEDRSAARMAKAVAQELGRVFGKPEISDAIKLCYDRSPEFVAEYLEENFRLVPEEEVGPIGDMTKPETDTEETSEAIDTHAEATEEDNGDELIVLDDAEDEPETNHAEVDDLDQEVVDGLEDESTEEDVEDEPVKPPQNPPKPPKPSLIERFALAKGYIQDGTDRFRHRDGSWLQKVPSRQSFSWEWVSASGEVLQYYWPREHCIERQPLELDADVWSLCGEYPDRYTLLLADANDAPREIPGRRLREMCDSGELILYPAKYRLVYEDGAAKRNSQQATEGGARL